MNHVLESTPVLGSVAILFLLKIFATSITIGSGGSGGIFTPTLFVGVALGLLVGNVAAQIWPGLDPKPYGVVGMAAAVTAIVQAPITAIFLLFEMTGSYEVALPALVTSILAVMVASTIEPESKDLLLRVLERMSEDCRRLWSMVLAGLSYREMSRRTGIAEGALRVRVLRCRKRAVELREELMAASN